MRRRLPLAVSVAGLVLALAFYKHERARHVSPDAPRTVQEPGELAARPAPAGARPSRHSTAPAVMPVAESPLKLGTVAPAARPGEDAYDANLRVDAIARWEAFKGEARLTEDQAAAILRIVYDAQLELANANEEGWRVLSEARADFPRFEGDKLDAMQADLDAHVRAVLRPEQADAYRDDSTISINRLELIGGLVAAQR